jgi:hypothetical protein
MGECGCVIVNWALSAVKQIPTAEQDPSNHQINQNAIVYALTRHSEDMADMRHTNELRS